MGEIEIQENCGGKLTGSRKIVGEINEIQENCGGN